MLSLGGIAFASPWVLLGFIVVPALWWLLRVTPPAPTVVTFPAIRLLLGLSPREETPARTPLWLILLRMVLSALLILALAHPLVNPSPGLAGSGPLLLAIDDGWAAAPDWTAHERLAVDLIDRAEREGREVAVLTTARSIAADKLALLRPADARALVQSLRPKPWPTDRAAAAMRLDGAPFRVATVHYLSDGLADAPGSQDFVGRLARFGPTTVAAPTSERLARLLAPGPAEAADLTVTIKRAVANATPPLRLRALAEDGRLLAEGDGAFASDRTTADIAFKMPAELRNRVGRIELAGDHGVGGTLLLDEGAKRRPVGIVSDRPAGSQQPLLSEAYYLERALQPFAELRRNTAPALIDSGVGMIVLPDGDTGAPETRDKLKAWVEHGGVLVRFASAALAGVSNDDLLPVTLRQGDRTIGGAMSWEKPAHLAAFPANSPFAGLAVPSDVTVARQVLAEPAVDLPDKTWARLSDGTPLVTGEKRGTGWLVLVHTSANASWSNLALSGLYVDMLRRMAQLGQESVATGTGVLAPWQVMDGFGRLGAAPPSVRPIQANALAKTEAGPEHPPGLYGTEDAHVAFNLASSVGTLAPLGDPPAGVTRTGYVQAPERDLRPVLLGTGFLLLLIDILIGYRLRGLLRPLAMRRVALLLAALVVSAGAAQADGPKGGPDAFTLDATSELHLAYVKTGDDQVDRISRDGLAGLDAVLGRRTSVDTGDPMAVDVERDELIFFPLIYWPVTGSQAPLSADAAARVNRYIETGGTILFDTQDQGISPQGGAGASDTAERLTAMLKGVHVPPLVQIPADHVLTKSFYLLQDFPGRWVGGTLWVEPVEDRVNDGVSTVIIGSNGWAAAWAIDAQGLAEFPAVPGGDQQREMAYRFGVNLVMYALTGNYKADQVHVPAILERLGQ